MALVTTRQKQALVGRALAVVLALAVAFVPYAAAKHLGSTDRTAWAVLALVWLAIVATLTMIGRKRT